MTMKGGTSQACAACKYQRRRCAPDCALAPYFPAEQPKMFQNAHRLFGVSNILKILKPLDPAQQSEAMRSIIYQSNIRDKYRVHGCVGVIHHLQCQILQTEIELETVLNELNISKQEQYSPSSHLPPTNPALISLFQPHQFNNNTIIHPQNYLLDSAFNSQNYLIDSKENMIKPVWTQPGSQQRFSLQQYEQLQERQYNEYPVFFDTEGIDDRQSYVIDCKDPLYESSCSESSFKDTKHVIEYVEDNELKSAAACFSLTNVNLNG